MSRIRIASVKHHFFCLSHMECLITGIDISGNLIIKIHFGFGLGDIRHTGTVISPAANSIIRAVFIFCSFRKNNVSKTEIPFFHRQTKGFKYI